MAWLHKVLDTHLQELILNNESTHKNGPPRLKEGLPAGQAAVVVIPIDLETHVTFHATLQFLQEVNTWKTFLTLAQTI